MPDTKYTPSSLQGQFASTAALNSEFQKIADVINDEMLSRYNPSRAANQMLNDLDMNSNTLLNVATSSAGSSVVTRDDLEEIAGVIGLSPVLALIAGQQVREASGSYAFQLVDQWGYLRTTGSAGIILTLDTIGAVNGAELHVRQQGTGLVTLVAGAGVTINTPYQGSLYLAGVGATVTLKHVGDNEWDLMGQVLGV